MHFSDESAGSIDKSKIPSILKIPEMAEPDNTTKQIDTNENSGNIHEEQEGRELYKLWADYSKTQNDHIIQMATEVVCCEA